MGKAHLTSKYHKQRRKERANARLKKKQQAEQVVTQPVASVSSTRPSMEEAFK